MKMPLWHIDLIPWHVFAAYWLIAWLHVRRTKTTETLRPPRYCDPPHGAGF